MALVVNIDLIEGVVIAKVIEDQVLHYVMYLTGSIGSTGSSGNGSSSSRRHGLSRRRSHSKSKRGSGTSLCEVPEW